jgi:hypothetical protein
MHHSWRYVFLSTKVGVIQNTQQYYEIQCALSRLHTVAAILKVKQRDFLDVIWILISSLFLVKREHFNILN